MYFSDLITLRLVTNTLDSYGAPSPSYVDTTVFANRKSVMRSEFYSASMAGIKIDDVFEVHVEDWKNQTQIIIPATAAKATVKAASAITDTLTIKNGTGASTLKILLKIGRAHV